MQYNLHSADSPSARTLRGLQNPAVKWKLSFCVVPVHCIWQTLGQSVDRKIIILPFAEMVSIKSSGNYLKWNKILDSTSYLKNDGALHP